MLIALALLLVPDEILVSSPEYDEIRSIRDWRMWVGPGYVFLIATFIGFFGTVIGGVTRLFGWRHSRTVLLIATIATLAGYPGYDTYAYTYIGAGTVFVWIFLMGWLVATPVPSVKQEESGRARKTSIVAAIAVVAAFSFHGWYVFGMPVQPSFWADVSIELDIEGVPAESSNKFKMKVGRIATIRVAGYIVDIVIRDASEEKVKVELSVFESLNGTRDRALASCVDFEAGIGELVGVGVSCGPLVIGLSGQFDVVD